MGSNPIVEQRIREIQDRAADRRSERDEAAAKQSERERKSQEAYDAEHRSSVSPAEVTAQQRHHELCNYYADLHQQKQAREAAEQRNKDIATMADLKAEWDKAETTPARKNNIVVMYAALYKKYVSGITPEMILKYWEGEKRRAMLQMLYGAMNEAS